MTPFTIIGRDVPPADWLELRRSGIGASEIAAVLGASTWGSPISVWSEKISTEPPDLESPSEAALWGTLLEPVVLAELGRRAEVPVTRSGELLRSTRHPWALATLDGWAEHPTHGRVPAEAKTAAGWKESDWEDGPPFAYRLQVEQQLLVTGAPVALIGCLLGGQRLIWCWIESHPELRAQVIQGGSAFWRYVLDGELPPTDGHPATLRALARIYPRDDGSAIRFPDEICESLFERDRIKTALSELEARGAAIDARLKAELGSATEGTTTDGRRVTWKTNARGVRTLRVA